MTSRIYNWFVQLFSKQVYYYNGQLYKFVSKPHGEVVLEPAEQSAPKFLIVSPKYVSVEAEKYPVANKKELHKILALKTTPSIRYCVSDVSKDNGAQVLKYKFSDGVPPAWFKIPEIAILGQLATAKKALEVQASQKGGEYFLAKSGEQLKYAPKAGLLISLERLKVATGVSADKVEAISWNEKGKLLKSGLLTIGMKTLIPFLPKRSEIDFQKYILASIFPASGILFIYMSITSAVLLINESYLTSEINSQSQQLGNLLELNIELDEKRKDIVSLNQFLSERHSMLGLWQVLAPLFQKLTIDQITLNSGRIVFRAQGESATQILEEFRKSQLVDDAKFDSPVLTLRNGERFTISFALNSGYAKSAVNQ